MFFSLICPVALFAQEDWQYIYSQDETHTRRLFEHYYQSGAYTKAIPYLEWLLVETNDTTYVEVAQEMYFHLATEAKTLDETLRYGKLCLAQYDKQKIYTADTASLLNRKLNRAFNLYYKVPDQYLMLATMAEEVLRDNNIQFAYYNFVPYISLLMAIEREGTEGVIDATEVAARLQSIAKAPGNANKRLYQSAVDHVNKLLGNNQ